MSTIYEPKGRAREYSPLAFNYFHGCTHNCLYCYVPQMFGRYNTAYNHADCFSNLNVEELERSARKMQGCGKQILLSFTGDPYCGKDVDDTRKVLEILNKYGHHVAILTKGGERALQHLDVFKDFGNRIKIGATLTFSEDADSLKWESGGALPKSRLVALQTLRKNGITTWASFEPVVIPSQSLELLDVCGKYGLTSHVKIGKINNYQGIDRQIDWSDFLRKAVAICRKYSLPFYIKEDLRKAAATSGVILAPEEMDQDFLNV